GFGAASREHPDAPPVEFLVVRESRHRVAHLARAVRHLSAGGLVGIAMDGRQGTATVEVPFLGRGFAVTRGPALLPRLTGAPLIPVVATWASDGAIEVRSFEPLAVPPVAGRDPEQWDRAVLTLAAQFFEALVRRTPVDCQQDGTPAVQKHGTPSRAPHVTGCTAEPDRHAGRGTVVRRQRRRLQADFGGGAGLEPHEAGPTRLAEAE